MAETRYIISDAARMINVEPHVLRYWEEELDINIRRFREMNLDTDITQRRKYIFLKTSAI